jgi:branched-chain amino acid transport system substrate-binding protein
MKKKGFFVVIVSLVLMFGQVMAVHAEEKVFKIGAALAFSGPLAFVGNGFRNGAQITADYFNEKGGLRVGGDTYRIEIVDADTKFTADGATTAARRLVDSEKVDMVIGAIAGPQTLGVLSVTEPAKILTLHSAGVTESIDKKHGRKYSFRGWMSYDEIAPGVFKWFKANRKIQRVAMLDLDYESSHHGHAVVQKICKKLGMVVVYDEFYEGGTKDLSPFLLKAIAKRPDLIFNTSTSGAGWGLLIKQGRELGYEGLFGENHPPTPKQTGEIAGMDNMQGLIGFGYASSGEMAPKEMIAFKKAYVKKYGSWHEHATVLGIPLASVLLAIEKAGSLDSDKIAAVLESGIEWETPWGIKGTWGGTKSYGHPHQWFAPQYAIEVQGEDAVPVGLIPMSDLLHGWD